MKEEQIFHQALELVADRRAAYLDEVCGQDANLRERVEILLQAHANPGSFLASPALAAGVGATLNQPSLEKPGTQIGPYKLLEQIGEGGFGVVYMAEQQHPVRRKIALKVIKPGMDTRQVISRFEAERQALSLMDHPNIAKVLDAATTDSGRPYFVMELVKGQPITTYCDEKLLTPRERLELLLPVCQAIQHAHQKGIIHRDIKPTNILVAEYDQQPVPKVIDFGVAKATGSPLTEKTMFTGFGQIVGTMEYMSPEQAKVNQLDIDTRSDIYSLGVLMYELLTGSTPFDKQRLRSAAWDEMLRIIREEEPPRPSTRLSSLSLRERAGVRVPSDLASVAASRSMEPSRLSRTVRGELDWIVMKALEKDRSRRYDTVNSFSQDLERYLADEPVQACPPSAAYRLRKFVRRNKGPVLAASLIFLALVAGVIGTTWGLVRAEQQRLVVEGQRNELADRNQALERAHERERLLNERARQAIETVTSETAIDQLTRQNELRVEQKEFLDKMIQYYAESTQEGAATEQERSRQARAYYRIGRMNQVLGRLQDTENAYRRAVTLSRQLIADFPGKPEYRQELVESYNGLGSVLRATERPKEAESAYGEALAILKQLAADFPTRQEFRQALAGFHNNLGNLFGEIGRPKEAEDAHAEALAIRKQLAADFPTGRNILRALAMSHSNLGWIFKSTNRLEKAEAAFRDAVALQRRHLAEYPNQPEFRLELAKYLFHLGNVLRDTGWPTEAEAARSEALAIFQQLVADYPNRPQFRQELVERGLPERGRGVGDESEEDPTSGALGTTDFPKK